MPGGTKESHDRLGPMFEKISAKAPRMAPCCIARGPDGAGHFVKMVHNGIEYAISAAHRRSLRPCCASRSAGTRTRLATSSPNGNKN